MKKIYAVGLGPGNIEGMTLRARDCIEQCDVIVGYNVYTQQVRPILKNQLVIENGMGQEKSRCEQAIQQAVDGKKTVMVCSGDSGLYGMAGLIYELLERDGLLDDVQVEVVPGATSALTSASLLGAPIVEDFCTISLSDYMTDKEKIFTRIEHAVKADFTIALYNPRSKKRPEYLQEAIELMLEQCEEERPVGIVRNAYREDMGIIKTTLGHVPYEEVDMFCTVIVGNSKTKWIKDYMVTSRGYQL